MPFLSSTTTDSSVAREMKLNCIRSTRVCSASVSTLQACAISAAASAVLLRSSWIMLMV